MAKKKSWADKMASAPPHEVKPAPLDMAGMKKGEIMLVPSPAIIAKFISGIPRGKSMDARELRARLARRHRAQICCPITTGILLRVVAEAALEAHGQGAPLERITPFWRVLDETSSAAKKLSCGTAFLARRRREEGL